MREFNLKPEHLILLQNAVIRWEDCEFGAPAIDCKRPYGNTSVFEDMCEILGWDYGSASKDELRKLHEETETALQIILQLGRFEEGRYTHTDWKVGWEYAGSVR